LEQKKPVPIGVVLMVMGVVLFIVAYFPFPLYSGTDNILNETHTVSAGYFYRVSYTFSGEDSIHIAFTVSGGAVDFWVMDEGEYNHFKNGEGFNYYASPSLSSVSTASIDWIPPQNKEVCFVWENTGSGSKSVTMSFSGSYAVFLPAWARFVIGTLGCIPFSIGLFKVRQRALKGTQKPTTPVPPPPVLSVTPEEKRFCRYCRAENKTDADFCEKCEKKIG
jgi:hypothetical protein